MESGMRVALRTEAFTGIGLEIDVGARDALRTEAVTGIETGFGVGFRALTGVESEARDALKLSMIA